MNNLWSSPNGSFFKPQKCSDIVRRKGWIHNQEIHPFLLANQSYKRCSQLWEFDSRHPQFSIGWFFVYLSLCNPQSEKSCDISFIPVKLPKYMYSQLISSLVIFGFWYEVSAKFAIILHHNILYTLIIDTN